MPALPGDRAQRRFAVGPADRIEDDVDAVLAAELLERAPQILRRIVHRRVGAMGACEGELVVAAGAGDHARAHQLAELDRREADAAGGAEHRERLAGLEMRAVGERVVARAIGDGEAGRAVEIESGCRASRACPPRPRCARAPRRRCNSRARGRRARSRSRPRPRSRPCRRIRRQARTGTAASSGICRR